MIRELNKNECGKVLDLAKYIKPEFNVDNFSANSSIVIYEINDNIVAFLEYYVNYETVELLNIAVDTKYRNQGIASRLISYLTTIDGVDRIMLEVCEANKDALSLYNKLNFKIVRTVNNYYDSLKGYAMERRIK